MRADAMLERGDLDGYAVWRRALRAALAPMFNSFYRKVVATNALPPPATPESVCDPKPTYER
jgi:hypothetical protein